MNDTHDKPVWPPLETIAPIRYRKATAEDATDLASRVRAIDIFELALTSDEPVLPRIHRAIEMSDESWAVLEDDRLVAIFGVCRSPIGYSPWLLGTDRLDAHLARCTKDAKQWLSSIKRDGILLGAVVWEQNHGGLRWIERLGFRALGHMPKPDGSHSGLLGFAIGVNHV